MPMESVVERVFTEIRDLAPVLPAHRGTLANLKRTYVIMHSQLLLVRLHSHKRDAPLPCMVVIDRESVS